MPSKAKKKIDPRLTAMARELRDRWSERAAEIVALPARDAKHDLRRIASPGRAPGRALGEATEVPEGVLRIEAASAAEPRDAAA